MNDFLTKLHGRLMAMYQDGEFTDSNVVNKELQAALEEAYAEGWNNGHIYTRERESHETTRT